MSKIRVFLERSHRRHQFCVLPIIPWLCDRTEIFSWCPVRDHWCLVFDQMVRPCMWTRIFFVSLLSSIDF